MTNRSFTYSRLASYEEVSPNSRRDSSTDDDVDSLTSTKLRRLHTSQNKRDRWPGSASHFTSPGLPDAQKEYLEHVIKPGETLQGLALLYRCTVFELKVANNIQKETEFFARRSLKIPVRQHSSLTEKLPSKTQPAVTVAATSQNRITESTDTTSSSEFLKQMDQDLNRLKEKARVYDIDSLDSSLTPSVNGVDRPRPRNRTDCQGDDCGLSWPHILGLALLVLLACPLLYFLYLELNLHQHQSTTMNSILNNDTKVLP